jgi:hypothetical protein
MAAAYLETFRVFCKLDVLPSGIMYETAHSVTLNPKDLVKVVAMQSVQSAGQLEPDSVLSNGAFGTHVATMGFDQIFDDGQTYAGPTTFTGPRLLDTIEALKDQRQLFVGDLLTGIGDDDIDETVRALDGYANVAS